MNSLGAAKSSILHDIFNNLVKLCWDINNSYREKLITKSAFFGNLAGRISKNENTTSLKKEIFVRNRNFEKK